MSGLPPLRERTIGDYLDRLGSSHPDPGGGSVAGLVGALAAALGQMVISLTRDANALQPLRADLQATIDALLASSLDDERAYGAYVSATRLPKDTVDGKAARRTAMQAALANSANAPLRSASMANDILRLLVPVVEYGTSHALSDVEIAVSLAEAAVHAALANVRINIPLIRDEGLASTLEVQSDQIESEAASRAARLRDALSGRRGHTA